MMKVPFMRPTWNQLSGIQRWRRKWQPTPMFLPGESQGQGRLVGCPLWGHTESDTTEVTQQQQQALFWSFRFSRSKELGMCISEAPPGKLTCSSREPRLQGSIQNPSKVQCATLVLSFKFCIFFLFIFLKCLKS